MILLNNRLVERSEAKIDIEDRGYQFGDGVYEVIRVYNGKSFLLDRHLVRLNRSASAIDLPLPWTNDEISTQLERLAAENKLQNGIIYMQVTRGAAPRNHPYPQGAEPVMVAYTRESERPLDAIRNGIKTIFVEDIRWLRCDIKSLNLLGNVMAKQQAIEAGAQEAILHRGETITEGSASNVMMVKNGTLYTHPANNLILNGITRVYLIEQAKVLGIPVEEKTFTKNDLLEADEVMMTSTTLEATPVIKVDGHAIKGGIIGPVAKQLQACFDKVAEE